MQMQLTESLKSVFIETSKALSGSERRLFMARAVVVLGVGGQRLAEAELGWNRGTIRKGMRELASGIRCHDAFTARGRQRIEERLPNLLGDIKAIVDTQSQTDPSFKSTRLYTRLSSAEVRRQLIAQKQYTEEELPSEQTIRRRLNQLGYYPARVAKTKPLKTIPETKDILAKVTQINLDADRDETTLRLSLDAKAVVKTQFIKRIVEFAHKYQLNIRLAYYPPYFSKYNPIERTWAVLENHWNGSLLEDVETVLRFAQTMTWKGQQPTVTLVTETYTTGIRLTKPEMAVYESQIQRLSNTELEDLPNLGKWFVDISCRAA
jgi:transposase